MLLLKRLKPQLIERRRKRGACTVQAALRHHALIRCPANLRLGSDHLLDEAFRQVIGDTAPGKFTGGDKVGPQDCVVRAHYFGGEKTSKYSLAVVDGDRGLVAMWP